MTVNELVKRNFEKLNQNDLHIWNYICQNKHECQQISIYELANKCNVSHSTVMRFAKKLSLNGFAELKMYLRLDAKREVDFSKHAIDYVSQDYLSIIEYIKNKDCNKIFSYIQTAKKIYVYGIGSVQINAAREFKRIFLSAHVLIHCIEGINEMNSILEIMEDGDLIFIFPKEKYSELLECFTDKLNKKKIHIVCISKTDDNILLKQSDESISINSRLVRTGHKEDIYESTTFYFIVAEMLFLKYLKYINKI